MRISIRWKWMIANLVIWCMVLLFMVTYLGARLEDYFESRFERRWRQELELARDYLQTLDFEAFDFQEADQWADQVAGILEMRVTLIDMKGTVLGDSEVDVRRLAEVDDHSRRPEVVQAISTGFGKRRRYSTTLNRDLVYLARPLGSLRNPRGILRIAVPVSEIEDSLSQIHRLVWLASGLGFGLVLFIGFFVSKSMTQSLNEMVAVAKRIARGDFSKTVKPLGNDEVADLGRALNKMSKDLQRSVEQITRERDQLHAILNSMVEGVVVTDREGRIKIINESFRDIFQLSGPIIDKSTSDVFKNSQLIEALDRALARKEDVVEDIEILRPFRKHLEAHIVLLGSKDKPRGQLIVFHDITRLKHLENVRRDFVANVSHEIRTPITAIKGYVETILQNGELDKDKARQFLDTILRNTDRMAKLVDDLLHLSKTVLSRALSKVLRISGSSTRWCLSWTSPMACLRSKVSYLRWRPCSKIWWKTP